MSCGFRCRGQVGRGTGMGALLLALVAMCGVDTTAHGPLHPVPVWDDRAAPLGRFRCSAAFLRPATPTHFGALAGRKGDAHLCRTREACFPGTGGPGPAATAIFRGGNAPLRADALWALTAARGATSGAAGGRGGASPPGEGGRDRDVAGEELAGARGGGAAIKGRRGAPPDTARRLLQELGLNETQLEAVCSGARPFPSALSISPAVLHQRCAFLLQEAGIPKAALPGVLATSPQLLHLSVDSLRENVEFLCEEAMIPTSKLATLITRFPHILKYNVRRNLRPSLRFLIDEVGIPEERMGAIICKAPGVLQLSVDANLRPKVEALATEAHVTQKQLIKLVTAYPRILGMSLDDTLRPKLAWLEAAGVPRALFGKVFAACPSLPTYSLEKLQRTHLYLQKEVGIPAGLLGKVLQDCPELYGLRTERVQENIDFVVDFLQLSPEEVSGIIAKYPRAMTYKVEENLRPKLQYLRDSVGFELAQVRSEVVRHPIILGYSLEKRIRRRHQHLVRCGVQVKSNPVEPGVVKRSGAPRRVGKIGGMRDEQRSIELRSMLTPPDDTFFRRYRERNSVHWIAHGTTRYDPYGKQEEEEFSIDLSF